MSEAPASSLAASDPSAALVSPGCIADSPIPIIVWATHFNVPASLLDLAIPSSKSVKAFISFSRLAGDA